MNPALIVAMNFLLNSTRKVKKQLKPLSEKDKSEINKINNMGLFEAINYLKKKQ